MGKVKKLKQAVSVKIVLTRWNLVKEIMVKNIFFLFRTVTGK